MGTVAEAVRIIPALSPRACLKAAPNARPQSSTVWCGSICRSPAALILRSNKPCTAIWTSIWSKKPIPVSISCFPDPSRLTSSWMSVSFVLRSSFAVRIVHLIPFSAVISVSVCACVPILIRIWSDKPGLSK